MGNDLGNDGRSQWQIMACNDMGDNVGNDMGDNGGQIDGERWWG